MRRVPIGTPTINRRLRLLCGVARIVTVLSVSAGTIAQAQTAPPSPAPITQIVPPNHSQVERVPLSQDSVPHGRLTISGGIEHAPCPLDAPRFSSVKVALANVVFDGMGPVDPASLDPAWRPLVGQTVPIATICEIRDAAATILRRQGYLAAVQVPPQRIDDGTVHLSVLMARLVAVHVRGDAGHAERLISRYLDTLKSEAPFNQKVAERALLLAGDLPGFDVHLTLRSAGGAPGDVVGDVTVLRTAFAADVNVQNFGSTSVGRSSILVNVEANDVLGLGDRAVFGIYNTADISEQSVVQGSYEIRPGASGLTIAARATYAKTRPDIGNGNPVRARTLVGTLEASYPLIRRQILTLRVGGGLDAISQKLDFAGLPFTDDQLRMVYLRIDFDATDPAVARSTTGGAVQPRWRAAGSVELRHGLSGLGASHDCGGPPFYARCTVSPSISRLDADPQATLIRASGSAVFTLLPRITLAISPRAQIAFDPLLSFEQYSVGNYTIGRGYDPGALSGDSGYGVQTEARLGPVVVPYLRTLILQPFTFVDLARTWTSGPIASVYRLDHIITAGAGARVTLGDGLRAEVTLAKPIGETPLLGQDHGLRALVSLTAHFTPRR